MLQTLHTHCPANKRRSRGEIFVECYVKSARSIVRSDSLGATSAELIDDIIGHIGADNIRHLWSYHGCRPPLESSLFRAIEHGASSVSTEEQEQICGALCNRIYLNNEAAKRLHRCNEYCINEPYECPLSGKMEHSITIEEMMSNNSHLNSDGRLVIGKFPPSALVGPLATYDAMYPSGGEEYLMLEALTDFKSYITTAADLLRSPTSSMDSNRGTMMDMPGEAAIFFEIYWDEGRLVFLFREFMRLKYKESKRSDFSGKRSGSSDLSGESYGSRGKRMKTLGALVDALIEAKVDILDCSYHITYFRGQSIKFDLHRTKREVMRDVKKKLWIPEYLGS